jgi:hypothetical protein
MAWSIFTNLIPAVHSIFFCHPEPVEGQKKDAITIRAIK